MKKMIYALLLFPFIAKAQYFTGDKLPDLKLGKLLYQKDHSVSLHDYAGKFLVLDIMSLYCKSCIEALPKYDSIQGLLDNQKQVLILVDGPKEKAEDFLLKRGLNKLKHLRFIAMDEETKNSFNIMSYPFHVWIGKDNMIKAIADAEYLSIQNIHSVSSSGNIPPWSDISLPADEPLIDASKINNAGTTFYTLVQPYRNGLRHTQKFVVDSLRGFQQWNLQNLSIPALYKIAVKGLTSEDLAGKRWKILVKDSSRFFFNKRTDYKAAWQRKNHFSIEYILPLHTSSEQRHQKLLHDLNLYFGLNGRIEKQEMVCRVIRRANSGNHPETKDIDNGKENSITLDELLHIINADGRFGIFIQDEHLEEKIKLNVRTSQLKSIESIELLLNSHHLKWEETKREVAVFILTDQ